MGDHTGSGVGGAPQFWADPVVFADTRQTAKDLAGGEDSGDQAPDFEIAQPRAILKECPANYVTGGNRRANPAGCGQCVASGGDDRDREVAVINRNDCSTISKVFVSNFFAVQFPGAATRASTALA